MAAVNKDGNIGPLSSEISGTTGDIPDTSPPSQVKGLTVKTGSTTQLNLAWDKNSESDPDHYNIYMGTSPNFAVSLDSTRPTGNSDTNSYQSKGLVSSTTYYYKVAAVDNAGNIGPLSPEKSGTTAVSSSSTTQDKTAPPKVT